ncbi:MAG: S8 family serine peptidase [Xenococcaceae cyanobacterium]
MKKILLWFVLGLFISVCVTPSWAVSNYVADKVSTHLSETGINVLSLHKSPYDLLGRKISIGQVEIGRPGKFGFDKAAAKNYNIDLQGIFYRNDRAISNNNVDNHATMVATIMVSHDKRLPGVAPKAKLYSSAIGALRKNGQPLECLATQHIAAQNSDDIRAINISFGESLDRDPRENAKLDGNALLTQCIDWSARVHDVIYVVAGNQGSGGIPIPTDNFNGLVTAYSTKRNDKFTKVDFANLSALPEGVGKSTIQREINNGVRRAVGIVAPGHKIPTYNLEGMLERTSGTSFAAPQVTASVALLQEFGDRQILGVTKESSPQTPTHWTTDARHHEVMKAVLLNSADKIEDDGDGLLLGMARTMLNKNNLTWFESDAFSNSKIPLDIQMGTGHLNTLRAYEQFNPGQWSSETSVPNKGWDYRTVNSNSLRDYAIDRSLKESSYVAITLAWDRLVELDDRNKNLKFDENESFRDRGLNNLDLYLMSAEETNTEKYVCASNSDVDSVEHIFCKVPTTGNYKIRVVYDRQVNEPEQPFGLAWWTVEK